MRNTLCALVLSAGLTACATSPSGEQPLVGRAIDAMGGRNAVAGVRTVLARGTLKQWEPEQSDVPGGEMRFSNQSRFETVFDRATRTTRTDWVKDFSYPAPRTYTFSEVVAPDAGYVIGVDSSNRNGENMKASPPAHSMSGLRLATTQRELRRLSPGALLLEMQANPGMVQPAGDVNGQPALAYRDFIIAFDRTSGLPSRIRTLDYDGIQGDVVYDAVFSDWRDVGGVKAAHSVRHELNGRVVSDATLNDVRLNQPVDAARLAIPAEVRAVAAKPATGELIHQWHIRRQFYGTYMDSDDMSFDKRASQGLRLQELAPGVQHVVGGTHNSLIVEMSDHLVVFDAPISDGHSGRVMDLAKARYPGKPVRWLVLTHHHNDHASGVRAYLAEGATLVVGQGAADHWKKMLTAPITRNPHLKSFDSGRARIVEVPESHLMSDSRGRQVIAYAIDNPHAKGMLMGYLPDAKLGFVTDIWSPGPPLPAKPNPGLASVVNAVKKIGIQPERFAGGHGANADYASLARLAGQ